MMDAKSMETMIDEAQRNTDTRCGYRAVKEYTEMLKEDGVEDLYVEYKELLETVQSQQESIRQTGKVNMFNMAGVENVSRQIEFVEHLTMMQEVSSEGYIEMAEDSVDD